MSGKSTDVIDASFYLTKAFGDWFAHRDGEDSKIVSGRVLLVDDSPFFRNLLSPLLSVSGFRAVVADSAESAMTILEKDAEFDAVVVALPHDQVARVAFFGRGLRDAVARHHAHHDHPAHYLRATILFDRPFWRDALPESYWMLDRFGGCCLYDES